MFDVPLKDHPRDARVIDRVAAAIRDERDATRDKTSCGSVLSTVPINSSTNGSNNKTDRPGTTYSSLPGKDPETCHWTVVAQCMGFR